MIRISIFVLDQSSMMSLASVIDPLRAANRHAKSKLFEWNLLSKKGELIELTCGLQIASDGCLPDAEKADVLIVLAGFKLDSQIDTKLLTQLNTAASKARQVFMVEAGTWLLARAGVLDGRRVTTHWEDIEAIARKHQNINIVADRFAIDGKFWSSGGASPTVDMMLHYLRTLGHQALAIDVASAFIYRSEEAPQTQQSPLTLARIRKRAPKLAAIIKDMEDHQEEPLTIEQLAVSHGISKRRLEMLFKRFLSESPAAYYLRLRLQTARRLVVNTNEPLLEISLRTGFANASNFSRAFKARYGSAPSLIRHQLLNA